jgi:RimJ/RimL family protein N-acetyltransferase
MKYWPKCYSRDEAANWIQRQLTRYAKDGAGYWLALEKASGRPVGQAGLLAMQVDGADELGLGYMMHRPFWRIGFATEAAQACRDYGFSKLAKKRIVALVRPENLPSLGVVEKLKMKFEKSTHYADFKHLVFASQTSI